MILNNFAVTLGVMLLYFPPFLTWINQRFLNKHQVLIDMRLSLLVGAIFTVMLSLLIPQAWFVFLFYFSLFHFTRFYSRYGSIFKISKIDSFSLSVYLCFAVSVLWEWPIQLGIAQNPDALILSLFKFIAIPLFIYKVYKLGFKSNIGFVTIFLIVFLSGFALIPFADNLLVNLYRFAWAFLLLLMIPVTKDIRK